jgi:hypothetical protein
MPDFVQFQLTPALLFILVSHPATYRLTRGLGSWVATMDGLPKTGGLILHSIVFILLATLVMRMFSRVSYMKTPKAY